MIKLDDYHLGFDDGYKRAISDAAKVASDHFGHDNEFNCCASQRIKALLAERHDLPKGTAK